MQSDTIHIELGERSYSIHVGSGALGQVGPVAQQLGLGRQVLVVSDSNVAPLYASTVRRSLETEGFTTSLAEIPAGEAHKTLETVSQLYDGCVKAGLDRRSSIVALGGGVVGDIAGFVAATFLRGITYLQVPTTLLAQVDSSVGGKTGVDHPQGKNYIGAFYQPRGVWMDLATLQTLPEREVRAGMAEVIKYGPIWSEALFERIEGSVDSLLALDESALRPVVVECCRIKAEVVARDEYEGGLRAILNFGHTVAHALESITGYSEYLHGEAVSIGMVAESRIAEALGMVDSAYTERLAAVLQRAGLPVQMPEVEKEPFLELMRKDKKARGGQINLVLPTRMGHVETVENVDAKVIADCL